MDPASWVWTLNMYGPVLRRNSLPTERWGCEYRHRAHSVAALGRACTVASRFPIFWNVERYREAIARGESGSASGYVLPVPDVGDKGQGADDDGETDPLTTLRRDLASAANGRTMLAPSMASGFGARPWCRSTLTE